MNKLYILIIFLFSIIAVKLNAQQIPLLTQYTNDKFLINSAYAGSSNILNATLNIRQQFVGFEKAPSTQYFTLHRPIKRQTMGIGLKINNDKLGATNILNTLAVYSYHIGLGNGKLSMGIEGGIYNYSVNFGSLIVADKEYDNSIPQNIDSKTYPDASFGLFYKVETLYAGYSVQHLIKSNSINEDNSSDYQHFYKHHYLVFGNQFELDKEINIEPYILLKKTRSCPMQVDIAAKYNYKKMFSAGLLYRSGDALALLLCVGNKEGTYRIGYSYDFTLSKLASYSKGAHEIMLIYNIKLLPTAGLKELNPIIYTR